MIDWHCHLDLYPNPLALLPLVAQKNTFTLAVTTSPRAWQATSKVLSSFSNIIVALGLHPEVVEQKKSEFGALIDLISETEYVGEVGIDGSTQNQKSMSMQEDIFRRAIIACEKYDGKIISIHSRNAATVVLDVLERHCMRSLPILHWFSGTSKEMSRAIALKCWFSVGPAMVAGAKGRLLAAQIPIDKILPETDGPFARYGEKPIMPWEAMDIVPFLSSIHQQTTNTIILQLQKNSLTLQNTLRESRA